MLLDWMMKYRNTVSWGKSRTTWRMVTLDVGYTNLPIICICYRKQRTKRTGGLPWLRLFMATATLRRSPHSTDTCRSFMQKHHGQLRVKDLPKVLTWRLERDSNPRSSGWKATNLPMSHHTPCTFTLWLSRRYVSSYSRSTNYFTRFSSRYLWPLRRRWFM